MEQKSLLIGGDFLHHLFQERPADKVGEIFRAGKRCSRVQVSQDSCPGKTFSWFFSADKDIFKLVTARPNVLPAI